MPHPPSADSDLDLITPGAFVSKPVFSDVSEDDEDELVRALVGSRLLRSKQMRRMLLAHLLLQRCEAEEDKGGEDLQLARLLIGSRLLLTRKAERLLLAHLLREQSRACAM